MAVSKDLNVTNYLSLVMKCQLYSKGPVRFKKGFGGGKLAWHLDGTIDGGNVGGIWRKEKERKHV